VSLTSASKGVATRIGHGVTPAPRKLGKYRVLFELGRGGMATVYLAVTQSAGGVSKLVVLKALLPQYAAEEEARAMFLDEARLAAQLNHGNVVQTYEVGQEEDRQVIVMEYLEGQSLASLLKRAQQRGRSLPIDLHLRVLMQVLEGLHYTHELRGYDGTPLWPVHRDVSPQNVFVTYDGRAKLLDFGIAKATSSTTHTATGLIKGKIAYMAPEQMAGGAVDRRADVYAVGCMLWAAATGRKLWNDVTDVHILHDVMSAAIPSPRSRNPDCDPELERIVMKALARVEARYASALELHEDLERFCDARGIPDRPRELARALTELFAADRAELRARVEHELAQAGSGIALTPELSAAAGAVLPSPEPQLLTSRTILAATVNAPAAKTPAKRPLWLWAATGIPLAALATYLALPGPQQPQIVAADAQIARSAAPVATKPQNIQVELRSKPTSAQLFLDDQAVQGNPASHVFPKDGAVHRVRAELAGHRTASAEFTASGDQVLELSLQQIPPNPTSGKPVVGSRPPQRAAAPKAASPAASKPNCAQPFYIGADGIKKIKPACL
jgi:serine/threonine protein kinase